MQGEGLYTGTPMAFLRTVGCSVGHSVCTHCDTQFEQMYPNLGGGLYTVEELAEWVGSYKHVVLTGGEPLDRDLRELIFGLGTRLCHIETSGTVQPSWLLTGGGRHYIRRTDGRLYNWPLWVTVSPKPGYLEQMVKDADEVKVILGGLGSGPGWPTLTDAVRWADEGKRVYVQPRNGVKTIDHMALDETLGVVDDYPQLRLSAQLHKFLGVR
ncbi:MAG: 7-carboxy-7-deazaguanine synthase QueE [Candidatus Paceibacterota bacterium]